MPAYNLGTLTIINHDVKKLPDALGIPENRFDELVTLAREGWEHEDSISESIEYIAQRLSGSELVLCFVLFGRIWEENADNDSEE